MAAWVRSVVATACFAVAGLLAPAASCADLAQDDLTPVNLVTNGNFTETGYLTGWTYNTNVDNFYWQQTAAGTTDYAANGCSGTVCITGTEAQQNYLSQSIHTHPGRLYKLTFTYDAGSGGVNELQVLLGHRVEKDLVNMAAGATEYTVYFVAHRPETVLNFRGRQDNGFALLTDISVVRVHRLHRDGEDDKDE
jgi:hypothetical protein